MIKNNIRYRMAVKQIDQTALLEELSGLSKNTVNKLFRNKQVETVKLETLFRLCDALECNLSDLIEYTVE